MFCYGKKYNLLSFKSKQLWIIASGEVNLLVLLEAQKYLVNLSHTVELDYVLEISFSGSVYLLNVKVFQ